MALDDVRRVVQSFDGMTDEMTLDSRACMMTVGDLRKLLLIAESVAAEQREALWPELMGQSLSPQFKYFRSMLDKGI